MTKLAILASSSKQKGFRNLDQEARRIQGSLASLLFIAVRVAVLLPSRRGNPAQEEVRLASSSGRDSSEEETQTRISGPRREDGSFR